MNNFNLIIQFSESDTKKINSDGFVLAVVKGYRAVGGVGDTTPIWVALSPFDKNTITWKSVYGLYASPNPVEFETVISASSTLYPAKLGGTYSFANHAFDHINVSTDNEYHVINKSNTPLTFGLAQTVTANDFTNVANPVSAYSVDPNMTEVFALPPEIVTVFLYKKTVIDATILIEETPALSVEMADNATQTIHYNGTHFVLGPIT
jgi:hypothetical protein